MGVDVRLVDDNTDKIKQELQDRVLVALDAAGMQASTLAKMELQKSPSRIDTGLLRNSVTHAVAGQSAAIGAYSADTPKKGKQNSGSYSGNAPPPETPEKPAVYVGTNVEYAV